MRGENVRPVVLLAAGVLLMPCQLFPQQRPLRTDDAELVKTGTVRLEFGFEFLQGQQFPLSGLEGDLTRVGVTSVHVGIGEYAEFQLSGVIQDFLSVTGRTPPVLPPDFSGNSTSDFGDLILASKIKLAAEKGARPAFAFKFAARLPNASNESGLGTDTTGFNGSLLASKHIGRAQLLGNVGIAILDSPVEPATQADLVTYGLAVIVAVNPKFNLVTEISGRGGAQRVGNESEAQARLGVQFRAAGLRWDIAGIAGLEEFDAHSGVAIGLTYEFQAFGKKKAPTTVK
jgi:hypothetical protein